MKILQFLPIFLLLTGCTTLPGTRTINPSDPGQANAPTSIPISLSNGPLTLNLFSPSDDAIVAEPDVVIQGNVSEEAVLTINDEIFTLSPGNFSQMVSISEGPNALEIVASDLSGNEVDIILTVTYQP